VARKSKYFIGIQEADRNVFSKLIYTKKYSLNAIRQTITFVKKIYRIWLVMPIFETALFPLKYISRAEIK
jgi:hypothetical protein